MKTEDLKRWRATAESQGLTLSEWIRKRCDEVAVSEELIEAVAKKLAERRARLQPRTVREEDVPTPMTSEEHEAHNQQRRKDSMRRLTDEIEKRGKR